MKVIITDPNKLFSRYSLLCGIMSLLMPFLNYPDGIFSGFVFGTAAAALSVLSGKGGKKSAGAAAGMITGILGIILSAVIFASFYNFYTLASDPETSEQLNVFLSEFLDSCGISFDSFISAIRFR